MEAIIYPDPLHMVLEPVLPYSATGETYPIGVHEEMFLPTLEVGESHDSHMIVM